MDKMQGGYQALQIRLLNGRLFQKLLSKEPDAQYRSEQGKILTILWKQELGCATATVIALATGLANNTLTSMVKKLEEQGLVTIQPCTQDKRKKYISLTELGWAQKEIGERVSKELGEIFYQGFSYQEIQEFEAYQERIISNLKTKENDMWGKEVTVMIGITGVTGKLGSYVADLVDQPGIASIHLARSPERAKFYSSAEIRKMVYANTPEVVEALKGIDTLLMVSARESPERVKEHKEFLDAAKLAGVEHIVYTSFYGADEKATFTLSRDHAQTEAYIKELGFTYTFLRDNFYLDFLIDIALENGEIRGPAGSGKVSAVARKDTSSVAAEILLHAKKWENQTLNLTGPEELSMEEIVALLSKESGNAITYVDESVEEAYESRKKWPAQNWEYDAWVSTYTAIKAGEQAGVSTDVEKVLGRPAMSLIDVLKERQLLEVDLLFNTNM